MDIYHTHRRQNSQLPLTPNLCGMLENAVGEVIKQYEEVLDQPSVLADM